MMTRAHFLAILWSDSDKYRWTKPKYRCHLSVALSFVKECTKAALYLGGNSFGNGKYAVRTKVSNTKKIMGMTIVLHLETLRR